MFICVFSVLLFRVGKRRTAYVFLEPHIEVTKLGMEEIEWYYMLIPNYLSDHRYRGTGLWFLPPPQPPISDILFRTLVSSVHQPFFSALPSKRLSLSVRNGGRVPPSFPPHGKRNINQQ